MDRKIIYIFIWAMATIRSCYGNIFEKIIQTDIDTPFVKKLGRTLRDVPRDGNCGYWAIAMGNDSQKNTYGREDMLAIRRIVYPALGDDINAMGDKQLESPNCIKIARQIKKPIIVSGFCNDFCMARKTTNPNMITIYMPNGELLTGVFVDGIDANNQRLVGEKCLRASIDGEHVIKFNKLKLFEILYRRSDFFLQDGRLNHLVFNELQDDFNAKFFKEWVNISDVPHYPEDDEIPCETSRSRGANRDVFEQAWNDFFRYQIEKNEAIQAIVSKDDAIFIYNLNGHWVAALKKVNGNLGSGNLDHSVQLPQIRVYQPVKLHWLFPINTLPKVGSGSKKHLKICRILPKGRRANNNRRHRNSAKK
ncbi:MAG: hypothetical protein LBI37_00340 [Puniceicoccales bacterium]|jgi:hypothetical protein|nr:hypothetical protein [Puniceicoccales bacterium]